MTDKTVAAFIRGGAQVLVATLCIDALIRYLMPLLWEVHKVVNIQGAR